MIYVCNDLHGSKKLLDQVARSIERYFQAGDILIINGDFAGARGPILNDVVSNYYKARMGKISCDKMREVIEHYFGDIGFECSDSLILETIHSGVFCKILADRSPRVMEVVKREEYQQKELANQIILNAIKSKKASAFLVSGNGEVTILDHIVTHITAEDYGVLPKYRMGMDDESVSDEIQQIKNFQVINYANQQILLIGNDALRDDKDAELVCSAFSDYCFDRIIVHYPPAVTEEILHGLGFEFQVDRLSEQVMGRLKEIMLQLNLSDNCRLFYGHYHPSVDEVDKPGIKDFFTAPILVGRRQLSCTWVKPGAVCSIF